MCQGTRLDVCRKYLELYLYLKEKSDLLDREKGTECRLKRLEKVGRSSSGKGKEKVGDHRFITVIAVTFCQSHYR